MIWEITYKGVTYKAETFGTHVYHVEGLDEGVMSLFKDFIEAEVSLRRDIASHSLCNSTQDAEADRILTWITAGVDKRRSCWQALANLKATITPLS